MRRSPSRHPHCVLLKLLAQPPGRALQCWQLFDNDRKHQFELTER